jgi:hypothetical protein
MYVMEGLDGTVRKAGRYVTLVGELLQEKHPTYGFEREGEWVAFDRWSVCRSALELYQPRSAEELAALRVSRERGKAEWSSPRKVGSPAKLVMKRRSSHVTHFRLIRLSCLADSRSEES